MYPYVIVTEPAIWIWYSEFMFSTCTQAICNHKIRFYSHKYILLNDCYLNYTEKVVCILGNV